MRTEVHARVPRTRPRELEPVRCHAVSPYITRSCWVGDGTADAGRRRGHGTNVPEPRSPSRRYDLPPMRNRFRSERSGPPVGSKAGTPLFIGGVPRSGTHAVAGLLARHSRYAMVPRELGFHTGMGEVGLPDLFDGD